MRSGIFLSLKRACGEPLEVSGMATGWPEQPGLVMMAMGGAGQPTSDLSYVFHYFWAIGRSELTFSDDLGLSDALARRLCCQIAQRPVKVDPRSVVFLSVSGPGR